MSHTQTAQIELMNARQTSDTANAIALLNDRVRQGVSGPVSYRQGNRYRYVLTGGVACLPMNIKACALTMLAVFNDFNSQNDPHGEHDYGSFFVSTGKGEKLKFVWKFGYYAVVDGRVDWEHGSEAPEDESKTYRVLTLMLGEEC